MARTVLPVVQAVHSGIVVTLGPTDALNGNALPNDGHTVVVFTNLGLVSCTVTIRVNVYINGDASSGLKPPDRTVSVAPSTSVLVGPFPQGYFNQQDGNVWIDYSTDIQVLAASIM